MAHRNDKSLDSQTLEKLAQMIAGVRFAMLTTADSSGHLRSRPMTTQQQDFRNFDGVLWFFTSDPSPKCDEIGSDHRVNLSYADPEQQHYVSVSGRATVEHDHAKMKELWNPFLKTWFPSGLSDPHLGLIRVQIDQAEYWDHSSSKMVLLDEHSEIDLKAERSA